MKIYHYKVLNIVRVIDGDTVMATVDLGFRASITLDFRLSGIDTPEMRGASHDAGIAARDYLAMRLTSSVDVAVQSSKDKYGRYLGEFTVDGVSINQEMISKGFAVAYNGGSKATPAVKSTSEKSLEP